jgi:hypothetical protein
MVLETVHGESWKDVVHREVIAPIGMTGTTAYLSRIERDRIAMPHAATPDGFAHAGVAKDDANMHAAGGHFASARDLARFLAAHISGGVVDGVRVLPADPIALSHRMHVDQDRDFGPFHRFGWAYGWDLGTYEGDTLIHRFGGFGGYRSHMSFMPHHDIGVAVLVNADGPGSAAADLVATYAYDRLLNKSGVDAKYAARLDSLATNLPRYRAGLAEHLAERRARLAPLPHPIEAYAGTYESEVLGRMEWRVIAGGLEVWIGVAHSRAEVFDAPANRLRIEVGGGGQVAEFVFAPGGGPAQTVRLAGVEFSRTGGQ